MILHYLRQLFSSTPRSSYRYYGGAWKVAYADYVTAMMAFFLLLWLISTTSQETKEGIADYFTPTYGIKDQTGIGVEGGISITTEGMRRSSKAPPGIVEGNPQKGDMNQPNQNSMVDGEKSRDDMLFEKAESEMRQAIESDPTLRDFSENILVEQNPEGLKLELRDTKDKPMYEPGSFGLSKTGRTILQRMAKIIERVPNHISITGHTDGVPLRNRDYSNWELSTDRANSARRYLMTQGLPEEKFAKIIGRAAQDLLLPERPAAAQNRRIEIILLRGSHLKSENNYRALPRNILSSPTGGDAVQEFQKREEKARRARAEELLNEENINDEQQVPNRRMPSLTEPQIAPVEPQR
jgi:chemotaxis protein MotB